MYAIRSYYGRKRSTPSEHPSTRRRVSAAPARAAVERHARLGAEVARDDVHRPAEGARPVERAADAALLPITLCIGATFPFAVRVLTRLPDHAAAARNNFV